MAERKEYEMKQVTNLKECEEGVPVKLNLDEDAWEYGAPPPKNAYKLKLFLAKDGIKQSQLSDNTKDVYYVMNLECRIVSDNPEYDGVPVFTRVDTRVYRGKDISTMAGLLVACGYKNTLEKEATAITPLRLARYMEAALKKEPVVTGELEWRGSYQFLNDKGEETWVNAIKKYEDFPMLPDGTGRNHITYITDKTKNVTYEIRAQSQISRFFGKNDAVPKYNAQGVIKELKAGAVQTAPQLAKPITAPVAAPVMAPTPIPVAPPPPVVVNAAPTPTIISVGGGDDEGDTGLMLE